MRIPAEIHLPFLIKSISTSSQGKIDEATALGIRAVSIVEKAFGLEHPKTKKYKKRWIRS